MTVLITSAGRSGSTSILKAIGLSKQTITALEPEPTLNIESRHLYDGRLEDPYSVLARDVMPRIAKGLDSGLTYVEKHLSFIPFLPHFTKMIDCKFIITIRNGRDAVKSFLKWHNEMFPIIYQECKEEQKLGEHARKILENQIGDDPFNYSLPRPLPGDPYYEKWAHFSRLEMVSWYWSYVNQHLFNSLKSIPKERYLIVDYTNPQVEDIRRVYDFIGLTDFNEELVSTLLGSKVNSLEDRLGKDTRFESDTSWTDDHEQKFMSIAFDTMKLLGFTSSDHRPSPPNFGDYWIKDQTTNTDWYQDHYNYKKSTHETFKKWVTHKEDLFGGFDSVIDIGAGIGHGYVDFFQSKSFIGLDLSPKAVSWCKENYHNPKHDFLCLDIIKDQPNIKADLVFSHATVDNVYDVDAFIRRAARMTKKVLYLTNYRGYFGAMNDHRYTWDPKMKVFSNDISTKQCIKVLKEEGFQTIVAFPMKTHRDDIVQETVIIASYAKVDEQDLIDGHPINFDYQEYKTLPSPYSLEDVITQVNNGCAYFSEHGLDYANPLSYFQELLGDLKGMKGRTIGTMHDLALGMNNVNTAIRADIDMDLVGAHEISLICKKESVPVSFYVLHTAPYYGYFDNSIFYRNEGNAPLYKKIEENGCEIALHINPLELYLTHKINGSQAVKEELQWLRSHGITIRGTSPHNCAPVYGAENFEIFKGRSIEKRTYLTRNYQFVPLETLDEQELNLVYEASGGVSPKVFDPQKREDYIKDLPKGDFLRCPNWFKTYIQDSPYCDWGYNFNVWLIGKDMWVISGCDVEANKVFLFNVSWKEVRTFLAECDHKNTICIAIHPIYVNQRDTTGKIIKPAPKESNTSFLSRFL